MQLSYCLFPYLKHNTFPVNIHTTWQTSPHLSVFWVRKCMIHLVSCEGSRERKEWVSSQNPNLFGCEVTERFCLQRRYRHCLPRGKSATYLCFTLSARSYTHSFWEYGGVWATWPGACHRIHTEDLCRERTPEELCYYYQVHHRYWDSQSESPPFWISHPQPASYTTFPPLLFLLKSGPCNVMTSVRVKFTSAHSIKTQRSILFPLELKWPSRWGKDI